MKSSFKLLSLVGVLASLALGVRADQIRLWSDKKYSVGNGGAYVAQIVDGPIDNGSYKGAAKIGTTGFLTFCLEYNEYFTSGYKYNYTVNTGSVNGGVSGQTKPNYDGISNGTAFLYSQFAQGLLTGIAGFTYSTSSTGYGYLQNAIWNLEGEIKAENNLAKWVKSNVPNWNADSNGSSGVYALNLTWGNRAQDQLYFKKVPEQGLTIALLGLALLGLASFRRFFSK